MILEKFAREMSGKGNKCDGLRGHRVFGQVRAARRRNTLLLCECYLWFSKENSFTKESKALMF